MQTYGRKFSRTRIFAMSCAILVLALGAFILQAPGGFQIKEDLGSGADWFGAAGTWVIGVAAVFIAREERAQNRKERRSQETREARQLRGRRRLMEAKATLLLDPYLRFARFFGRPVEARALGGFYGCMAAAEQAVRTVTWSDEERFLLDEEGVAALYDAEHCAARLLYIIGLFRDDEHDWDDTVQIRRMEPMISVLRDIRSLRRAALSLRTHIQRIDGA